MNDDIKYNLHSYLNEDKTNHKYLLGSICLFIFLFLFLSFFISNYDIVTENATTLCDNKECTIEFFWPIEKTWLCDKIKINTMDYEIEQINFEEVFMDNTNNAYQKIILKVKDYKGNNNEIVKLKIYKNKEKIIKKVLKKILEREI